MIRRAARKARALLPHAHAIPRDCLASLDPARVYLSRPLAGVYEILAQPPGGVWVSYRLERYVEPTERADVWHLSTVALPFVAGGWRPDRRIVDRGVWEFALQLDGETGFVGNAHGYGTFVCFKLETARGAVELGVGEVREAREVRVRQRTRVERVAGGEIAETERRYRFTPGGLNWSVDLHWLRPASVGRFYAAMVPFARNPLAPTRARLLGDQVVQDVSQGGYPLRRLRSAGVVAWNPETGLRATAEVLNPAHALAGYRHAGEVRTWVHDPGRMNKFYATRIGRPTPVRAGERWTTHARLSVVQPAP